MSDHLENHVAIEAVALPQWAVEEFLSASTGATSIAIESLTPVEIQSLLKEEIESVKEAIQGKSIRLLASLALEGRFPAAVRGNAKDLRLAVASLLLHACESTGGGQGTIRVALAATERGMQLTIEDNGRGLSEAMVAKLESKGHLASPKSRLSLRQARMRIEDMGCMMDVQARLGVGSRVMLRFPRVDTSNMVVRTGMRELSSSADQGSQRA